VIEEWRLTAFRYGIRPEEFWGLTPVETRKWCEQAAEREIADHRLGLWSAWHQEAFRRTKRLPKLSTLLGRLIVKKAMTGDTTEELRDKMRVFAEQTNAIDLRKKNG
jgi:hypothetical protein